MSGSFFSTASPSSRGSEGLDAVGRRPSISASKDHVLLLDRVVQLPAQLDHEIDAERIGGWLSPPRFPCPRPRGSRHSKFRAGEFLQESRLCSPGQHRTPQRDVTGVSVTDRPSARLARTSWSWAQRAPATPDRSGRASTLDGELALHAAMLLISWAARLRTALLSDFAWRGSNPSHARATDPRPPFFAKADIRSTPTFSWTFFHFRADMLD